jgi:hypothetical protein
MRNDSGIPSHIRNGTGGQSRLFESQNSEKRAFIIDIFGKLTYYILYAHPKKAIFGTHLTSLHWRLSFFQWRRRR